MLCAMHHTNLVNVRPRFMVGFFSLVFSGIFYAELCMTK
jgi:hypothetical protein